MIASAAGREASDMPRLGEAACPGWASCAPPFTVSEASPIVRHMKRLFLSASAVVTALSLPAVALAENMSSTPSDGTAAQQAVASGEVTSGGALPFTGLNLALIVIAGLALVAAGLLLRRRSHQA